MTKQAQLTGAFVAFADTLTSGFDLVEFLHTVCANFVELFEVDAAGLLLAGPQGNLKFMAASSEQMRLLELFQLQNDEGPCLDSFQNKSQVRVAGSEAIQARWPSFSVAIREAGFAATYALPMRCRDEVIGTINAFAAGDTMSAEDMRTGQALADVATIGLLQERALREAHGLSEQLQIALNTRVIIEQAKGKLAEQGQLEMEQAFSMLRETARKTQSLLSDVARQVIDGSIDHESMI